MPGQVFQRWIDDQYRRQAEKRAWSRQLEFFAIEQEARKAAEKEGRIWQAHRDNVNGFLQLYQGANTPEERESVRTRFLSYSKSLPPAYRGAVEKLVGGSPFDDIEMRVARWRKFNPPPPAPTAEMAKDDPGAYLNRKILEDNYRAQEAQVRGVPYVPKGEFEVNEELFGTRDGRLHSRESRNKLYDEIGPAYDTNGAQLALSGGWAPPKQTKLLSVDENGMQKETVMNIIEHIDGRTKLEPIYTGKRPGPEDKLKVSVIPSQETVKMINFLETDTVPNAKHPLYKMVKEFKSLEEELYKKWNSARDKKEKEKVFNVFEDSINSMLQSGQFDNRFTYVLVPAENGQPTVGREEPWIGWNRLTVGKNVRIKAIPGQRVALTTKDGKRNYVIHDQTRNLVYSMDGQLIGSWHQAMELHSNMTLDDLRKWKP
jgi:hypothetical protein